MLSMDRTLFLAREGYAFTSLLRQALAETSGTDAGTADEDAIEVRLLGRRSLVVRGDEGVQLFYDQSLMRRRGAMPDAVAGVLFGRGAVHGLDGEAHQVRKAMFVDLLMDPDRIARLSSEVSGELDRAIDRWVADGRGTVYDTMVRVYGRSVIRWAGLALSDREADARSRSLAQIVEGFGRPGRGYARAWQQRRRSDEWAAGVIRSVREGTYDPPSDSVMALIAAHRDHDGALLDEHTAAVELQNVLRPTIAVARFAAFGALALLEQPGWADRLRKEDPPGPVATAFAQEVRRVYPFVPLLAAIATRATWFRGKAIRAGERVFIDIHGTNHDPSRWDNPVAFDPDRFLGTSAADSDHFVPQGGGRPETGHRCPGEEITVTILALTCARLSRLGATAPDQDLRWDPTRIPTLPRSGVILCPAEEPSAEA